MASNKDLRESVASYLTRAGWTPGSPGQGGELWRKSDAFDSNELQRERVLAVPFLVTSDSIEFGAIVSRLSKAESREPSAVAEDVEREFLDVQSYRIADSFVVDDTALLESASTVLQSAQRLLRAAATTARKPRAQIGSNFSARGDEVAARARLSHTRRGSFVLPIVMPLDPPQHLSGDGFRDDFGQIESSERRVTRMLATALTVLDRVVVREGREPRADDIMDLIQSGVSKELVRAVRDVTTDSGVHAFDTTFHWAAGIGVVGGIPERVVISDEASPLLSRVAQKLVAVKAQPIESVSGQIVEVRHVAEEPTGEIALRTIRNNRSVEVRVMVSGSVASEAWAWAKARRAIIARGTVTSAPGRPLTMAHPMAVQPIDELFVVKE